MVFIFNFLFFIYLFIYLFIYSFVYLFWEICHKIILKFGWLSANSVNKNIFWFLVYYFKIKSFCIIIINTKIMSYIINKILLNKSCDTTTTCFAIFTNPTNTYLVWKLIPIVGAQIIRTQLCKWFDYTNNFEIDIKVGLSPSKKFVLFASVKAF